VLGCVFGGWLRTAVCVSVNGRVAGVIAIADAPKPEAATVVHHLHEQGIAVYVVTGDNARVARAVAEAVGIPTDRVIAQVKPADKAALVEKLQKSPPLPPPPSYDAVSIACETHRTRTVACRV
jgi:P-type E1-E2 ATPase